MLFECEPKKGVPTNGPPDARRPEGTERNAGEDELGNVPT